MITKKSKRKKKEKREKEKISHGFIFVVKKKRLISVTRRYSVQAGQ
jgi:hypothetical protein